jgi:FkbM family methyltransferase
MTRISATPSVRAIIRRLRTAVRRRSTRVHRVEFGRFRLSVDPRDAGGAQYRDPSYWAELESPIERDIVRRFSPELFVDVGANYGFTSLVHHSLNPAARIVVVEPSPRVAAFLRRNLDENDCSSAALIEGVCSDSEGDSSLALNPYSSQDNRVVGEQGWPTINRRSVLLSSLIETAHPRGFTYIKIDTQGYEERVIRGGGRFLDASSDWLIKAEFAPKWLRLQGTDPVAFLISLLSRYQVIELPRRSRYSGDSLERLAETCLDSSDARDFTRYVESLARGDGWCDILVAPPSLPIGAP